MSHTIKRIVEHIRTSAGPRFAIYTDDEDRRVQLIQYYNEVHADNDEVDEFPDDAELSEVMEAIEEIEDISDEEIWIPITSEDLQGWTDEPVGPAPILPPAEDVEQAECMNCGWNGGDNELNPIKGFHERVQPGDTAVPAGECPECGCLAYLKEDDFTDEEKADMKHNAQMLDGCETEDELNAELRAQTQGN